MKIEAGACAAADREPGGGKRERRRKRREKEAKERERDESGVKFQSAAEIFLSIVRGREAAAVAAKETG